MNDWRFDESDDAEFDKGFDKFIAERNIQVFKKPTPLTTGSKLPLVRETSEPDVTG